MAFAGERYRVVLVAVVAVFLLSGWAVEPVWAQDDGGAAEDQYTSDLAAPGADEECPGAEVVATFGPATNDRRQIFETSGQSFRVTYQVEFTVGEERFREFLVEIEDEFGLVEFDSTDQSETRSFTVPEGPGSYEAVVDIAPNRGAVYTVIVEDCTGVDQQPPDREDTRNEVRDNDDRRDDDIINIPRKPLPSTGGPLLATGLAGAALLGLGLSLKHIIRHRP